MEFALVVALAVAALASWEFVAVACASVDIAVALHRMGLEYVELVFDVARCYLHHRPRLCKYNKKIIASKLYPKNGEND